MSDFQKWSWCKKINNQWNFMNNVHLGGTIRDCMSYFFDKWPTFAVLRTCVKFWLKKRKLPGKFFKFDDLFRAFRFLQPPDKYTFSIIFTNVLPHNETRIWEWVIGHLIWVDYPYFSCTAKLASKPLTQTIDYSSMAIARGQSK